MNGVSRGKLAILSMFALGCLLGGFAVWHHYRQGRRVLAAWGPDVATLVRHASRVEVWRLGPSGGRDAPRLQVGDQPRDVLERVEISRLPGLVHARHALIIDRNYDWLTKPSAQAARGNLALQFRDGDDVATLVFATQSRLAYVAGNRQPICTTAMLDRVVEFVSPHLSGRIEDSSGTGGELSPAGG